MSGGFFDVSSFRFSPFLALSYQSSDPFYFPLLLPFQSPFLFLFHHVSAALEALPKLGLLTILFPI
jgi:hypothetical protein